MRVEASTIVAMGACPRTGVGFFYQQVSVTSNCTFRVYFLFLLSCTLACGAQMRLVRHACLGTGSCPPAIAGQPDLELEIPLKIPEILRCFEEISEIVRALSAAGVVPGVLPLPSSPVTPGLSACHCTSPTLGTRARPAWSARPALFGVHELSSW